MRYALPILLMLIALPLLADQFSLTAEQDNNEGLLSRFYAYSDFNLGDWRLENTLTAKWTNYDKDKLKNYYLRNYARDRLQLTRTTDRWRLSVYTGGEGYYGTNVPTHLAGWDGRWDLQHGAFSGVQATAWLGPVQVDWSTDWWMQRFEALADSADDTATDYNLWHEGRAQYRYSDWLKPYVSFTAFDDLNELDAYDETTVGVGNEWSGKLNYIHTLRGSVEGRWSNTFDNEPFSLLMDARLTSKFGLSWMLVNRLSLTQTFTTDEGDDEDDDSGDGSNLTGFYEFIGQRTLNLVDNRFSRVQAGGRWYPGDETGYIELDALYWLGPVSLYMDAEKHFNGARNHRITGQLCCNLLRDHLRLGYGYTLDDRVDNTDLFTNMLLVELQ